MHLNQPQHRRRRSQRSTDLKQQQGTLELELKKERTEEHHTVFNFRLFNNTCKERESKVFFTVTSDFFNDSEKGVHPPLNLTYS